MNEKDMAENNKIIEIKTGSHLYGLNTPISDLDYTGIFIPDKEYVIGFKNVEEVDLSIKDKLDNGKNSQDAIDRKMYDFRKYIKLALQGNPNITELLFVDESNIIFINEIGKQLLKLRHEFLHKGLKERFIGYAISQKKKMIIKKDNYFALKDALLLLNKIVNNDDGKLLLPQCSNIDNFSELFLIKNETDNHYRVGDRCIVKNMTVKRAKQELEEIINMATNRKELIEENGFDRKFGSHLIRLLLEGIELLETGNLIFPLTNKKEIMDIKTGKWSLQQVLDYSEELESKINDIYRKTALPSKPNFELIESFMMGVLRDAINK